MISKKVQAIREVFSPMIGLVVQSYQTAEILYDDGNWGDWPDLPIRIYFSGGSMVSISWSKFDDLWLSTDDSLPFAVDSSTTRWRDNVPSDLCEAIGRPVVSVSIGRGEMSIAGKDIEIWTRLVIDLGDRWLEIFNNLDENGYDLHESEKDGEFFKCV